MELILSLGLPLAAVASGLAALADAQLLAVAAHAHTSWVLVRALLGTTLALVLGKA